MVDIDLNSEYLKEYGKAFPNAEPFIFYSGGNPLESLIEKQYGDIYFLISKPHRAKPEQYFFYKGNSIYFQWYALQNWGYSWSDKKYVTPYIVAYGSLDCLMFSKEERHSRWKEMVSEFFSSCRPYEERMEIIKNLNENEDVSIDFWAVWARNENGILIEESVKEWNKWEYLDFKTEEERKIFANAISQILKLKEVSEAVEKNKPKNRGFYIDVELEELRKCGLDPKVRLHFKKVRNQNMTYDLDFSFKKVINQDMTYDLDFSFKKI